MPLVGVYNNAGAVSVEAAATRRSLRNARVCWFRDHAAVARG